MTIVLKESHYKIEVEGEIYQIDQFQQVEKFSAFKYWKTYINGEEMVKRCSWMERETKPSKNEVEKSIYTWSYPSFEYYKKNNE